MTNVTLLFCAANHRHRGGRYMRGLERRVAAGLSPDVRSVASVFVSRWDKTNVGQIAGRTEDSLASRFPSNATRPMPGPAGPGPLAMAGRMWRAAATLLFASTSNGIRRPRRRQYRVRGGAGGQPGCQETCSPSPTTVRSIGPCGEDGDDSSRSTLARRRRAGIEVTASASSCRMRAPRVSSDPGRTSPRARSRPRARHCVGAVTGGFPVMANQVTKTAAWRALESHYQQVKDIASAAAFRRRPRARPFSDC